MKLFAIAALLLASQAHAADIAFTLQPATVRASQGLGADWNDKTKPLLVHVGDTLVFTNSDTIPHIIHTNGDPFPHGDRKNPIKPGQTVRIPVLTAYDSLRDGALYDHDAGKPSGQLFWIVAQ